MTPGLALFVKTPGRSPVKSRLWPAIGREAAEALYLDCAAASAEIALALQQEARLHAYWAVAEDEVAGDAACPWRGMPRLYQGEGGLGERMAAVYAALRERHGAALLMGTDVPQIEADALRQAVDRVSRDADVVLGPSDDGGFWLVGGRIDLPLGTWTAPRYSTSDACADFVAALPSGVRVGWLAKARDLDDLQDMTAVAEALAALPQPSAAQARVLRRLNTLAATMSP